MLGHIRDNGKCGGRIIPTVVRRIGSDFRAVASGPITSIVSVGTASASRIGSHLVDPLLSLVAGGLSSVSSGLMTRTGGSGRLLCRRCGLLSSTMNGIISNDVGRKSGRLGGFHRLCGASLACSGRLGILSGRCCTRGSGPYPRMGRGVSRIVGGLAGLVSHPSIVIISIRGNRGTAGSLLRGCYGVFHGEVCTTFSRMAASMLLPLRGGLGSSVVGVLCRGTQLKEVPLRGCTIRSNTSRR